MCKYFKCNLIYFIPSLFWLLFQNIKDPVDEFYWTKETIKKRRKIEKQCPDDTDSSDEDDEFEQYVTEENLFAIIDYIRNKHLYCLYCVITGIDIEDLKENCPGPYRIDHDGEIDQLITIL